MLRFAPLFERLTHPLVTSDITALLKGGWWWGNAILGWDCGPARFSRQGRAVPQADAFSFTRASVALATDDGVTWSSVGEGTLRRSAIGATLEPATTNMIRYSADPTNTAWIKGSGVVPVDTGVPCPVEGAGNWWRVNAGSVGANGTLLSINTDADLVVGEYYTTSLIIRATGANIAKRMSLESKRGTGTPYAGFVSSARLAGSAQRIKATFQAVSGNLKGALAIRLDNGDLPTEFEFCCPQFEKGKVATSPIRTDAAPVTRAADAATLLLPSAVTLDVQFVGSEPLRGQRNVQVGSRVLQTFQAPDAPFAIARRYGGASEVLDFMTRPGDVCFEDDASKERAEVMTGTRFPLNADIWNAYDLWIDGDFTGGTDPVNDWCIMGQWHGDASDGRSPYIAADLIGDDLVFYWRAVTGGRQELFRMDNVRRRSWIRIVMQHKVHATAGYMKLWIDGVLVGDLSGAPRPFGYYDHAQAGYWKEGIYRGAILGTTRCSIQNSVEGTADLTARIAAPPALNIGRQSLSATPTGGEYTLDAAVLQGRQVGRILAYAA